MPLNHQDRSIRVALTHRDPFFKHYLFSGGSAEAHGTTQITAATRDLPRIVRVQGRKGLHIAEPIVKEVNIACIHLHALPSVPAQNTRDGILLQTVRTTKDKG